MADAVVVAATRTPIARVGRSLAALSLAEIGKATVSGVLSRTSVDHEDIDDLILGEVLQGGGCTARYIAVDLGLPIDTPGVAVQRQCATGMMAVQDAAAQIRSGMARVVVAGGIESMTRSPLQFERSPLPFGGVERYLPPSHPDTPDAPNMNMLITVGENTAREMRDHPRGAGRVGLPLQHPGGRRNRRRSLRRRDRPRRRPRRAGRDGDLRHRRAATGATRPPRSWPRWRR